MYDPLLIPPDLQVCQMHGKATLVRPTNDTLPKCPCCSRRVSEKNYALELDLNKISKKIGVGSLLMYSYMTVYIQISLAILLIYGIPSTTTNYLGSYCNGYNSTASSNSTLQCGSDWIVKTSLVNKLDKSTFVMIQGYCGIGCTLMIALLIFLGGRKAQKLQHHIATQNKYTLAKAVQFTLRVSRLPAQNYDKQDLEDQLTKFYQFDITKSLNAPPLQMQVNVAYHLQEYSQMKKELSKIKQELAKIQYKKRRSQDQSLVVNQSALNKKYLQISMEFDAIQEQINNGTYRKTTSVAFVSFKHIKQRQFFLRVCGYTNLRTIINQIILDCGCCRARFLHLNGKALRLQPPPEPSDIIWGNCGVSGCFRFTRQLLAVFLMLILISINYIGVYYIVEYQANLQDLANSTVQFNTSQYFSILVSLMIKFVNELVFLLISKLGNLPKFDSHTQLSIFKARLYSVIMFLNTLCLPIFVSFAVFVIQNRITTDNIYGTLTKSGGLIYNLFFVSATMSAFIIIFELLNPKNLLLKCKRGRINSKTFITQKEANKIFEGPKFLIFEIWPKANIIVWMQAFYSAILPQITIFGLIGIWIYYYIQRYLLLRRYSLPKHTSSQIQIIFTESLYFALFLFTFGIALARALTIFHIYTVDEIQNLNYYEAGYVAPLILVLLFFLLKWVFSFFMCETINLDVSSEIQGQDYFSLKSKFHEDYDRENPCTQDSAAEKLMNGEGG